MIKKVIFDLDDTLFKTSVDAKNAYAKFFNNYKFSVTALELYDKLDELNYNDVNNINQFYEFLKGYLGNDFTKEVFEKFVSIYNKEVTLISSDTHKVLKYLKGKYEIIALSNWFYDLQIGKIKNSGLLEYFDKVYTIDTFGKKPHEETFKKACEPYEYSECAVVGDSLNSDIIVPNKLGMRAIYLGKNENYECISDLKELMDIL